MAIEVAVVGLGQRGRQWVLTVRSCPAYELVACVDVDGAALGRAAEALGVRPDRCYLDLNRALDEVRPDAIIVATSLDRHAEPCERALGRGLGVLVEKPFALSLREARALVSLASERKTPLVVAQNFRYTRAPQAVRRLLRAGAIGRVGMVVGQTFRAQTGAAPALGDLPNSVIWELAVHHLDALRFMLGGQVVRVAARAFRLPWSSARPGASLQALLGFEGGVEASFCATYDARGHEFFERGQEFYLRLLGERGTLHVFHRWIVLCERGRLPRLVRRGPRRQPEEVTLLRQLERAVVAGEEPECSGRDNLATVAMLEACARSAAEFRWVDPRELLREPL